MAIPSVKQIIETCPHGCGASINDAKKGRRQPREGGSIVYHRCKKCKKTYSVRYKKKENSSARKNERIIY